MTTATPVIPTAGRQAYLDWLRGLAVLIMIEAHVLDAWTLPADRTHAFANAMVLGGFAAPLFLFLAGVGAALSAGSKQRRAGDPKQAWKAVEARGWQIFGLAFLFRFQSYVLGGGSNLAGLLKVDILNVMGPALAFAGFLGRMTPTRVKRLLVFACVTLGIAMVTPLVRTTALLNGLPDPVEWYLQPRPGSATFTLFPWAGFVFAGAVIGVMLNESSRLTRPVRLQVWLAVAAVLLGVAAYRASFLPSIYPHAEFWTTSPAFFFLRVAVITALLPAAYAWEHAPWRGRLGRWSPIEEMGRSSLFVYWIHVEMVYGFLSRPLRRNLPFSSAVIAYLLFSAFILALVLLKNRIVSMRKAGTLTSSGMREASI